MPEKPLISPEYVALNKQLHAERADYGAAAIGVEVVAKIAALNGYKTVLDYGCGKGALAAGLKKIAPGLTILEFDPAIEGKDNLPDGPVDFIASLDVIEHVEPEYLDAVLETMCALRPKSVLLVIATIPAQKTLPDGRNAHLNVHDGAWWAERLANYFFALTAREDADHYLFVGKPLP